MFVAIAWYVLTEEHDIGLEQAAAAFTARRDERVDRVVIDVGITIWRCCRLRAPHRVRYRHRVLDGAAVGSLGKDGGIDNKASQPRQYSSDLYYGSVTAFDAVNHKVIAKAITDIEVRSGALATAGGLVFTALQDGWIVAYNDETLQELWRFNVGTPLKGAPVTYAIGPKQYLAVQAGGRHLHPVKFDKLENSSYLFVFALN